MDDLTRRNTETVRNTIKDMSDKILSQQIRIDGLNATITTLNNRIDNLERILNLMRAKQSGTGATVRE